MDALVATAIHDAKNSLNALGVWLAKARIEFETKDEFSPAAHSPSLARATAITATLTGQLVELLALYRAGEGSLRLAIEDHFLADFLADLMGELAESDPNEAGIVIDTDFTLAAEIGAWAFDAYLVKFALLDTLRNALRHAQKQIRFSLSRETGGGIRFRIEDDGEGYPPEMLSNANSAGTESVAAMSAGSSGLGLRFAHLIATRHATPAGSHGWLLLANDGLGKGGASFSMILP